MPLYAALLRGINVGGHKKVAMAALRDFAARLGLEEPRTLLQSGNLVFQSRTRSAAQLETLLESEAEKRLNVRTDFFVRTAADLDTLIAQNPFGAEARRDPSHVVVLFLKKAPAVAGIDAVRAANTGSERFQSIGRHLYIVFPNGIGRSPLLPLLTETRLGARATGRNWNTVLKLAAAVKAR